MEDPCTIPDSVDRDPECADPVIMYRLSSWKKIQRACDNAMLITELKRLTKSTAPKRHYGLPYRKGRK